MGIVKGTGPCDVIVKTSCCTMVLAGAPLSSMLPSNEDFNRCLIAKRVKLEFLNRENFHLDKVIPVGYSTKGILSAATDATIHQFFD